MEVTILKIPQVGALLISEPFLPDKNFNRTVIMLCEHNDEGSLGFIISKPLHIKVSEVIEGFPSSETELYFGGPVEIESLHYLHNLGDQIDGSVKIADGLYWGGNFETIKILLGSHQAKPENFRFFVGYSGWGAGQLIEEMTEKSWIITKGKPDHIFHDNPEGLWKTVLNDLGGTYSIVSGFPENPQYN